MSSTGRTIRRSAKVCSLRAEAAAAAAAEHEAAAAVEHEAAAAAEHEAAAAAVEHEAAGAAVGHEAAAAAEHEAAAAAAAGASEPAEWAAQWPARAAAAQDLAGFGLRRVGFTPADSEGLQRSLVCLRSLTLTRAGRYGRVWIRPGLTIFLSGRWMRDQVHGRQSGCESHGDALDAATPMRGPGNGALATAHTPHTGRSELW
jgi:hypothetical protein